MPVPLPSIKPSTQKDMPKPKWTYSPPVHTWLAHQSLLRVEHSDCECGKRHTSSSLWLVETAEKHPSVRRETPLEHPSSEVPFVILHTNKRQSICHVCAIPTKGDPRPQTSEREWSAAIKRDAELQAAAERKRKTAAEKPATFDASIYL